MPATLENLTTGALTVTALVLSLVAWRAWRHTESPKVLLLAFGFGLFFLKGMVLSAGLFISGHWETEVLLPTLVIDLAALSLFYAAALRRAAA